ncbi:type II secretion system protein [Arcobacter vandammei]|uniref:type II secretion system protein n=1 Tax=Arcobacter vandammei TaxID=2782243 RepID=UPI0018DEF690|nr:type II secretion system protein [Arcobacter vandammei]
MKKSSILFELTLILAILSIIYSLFIPKTNQNRLQELKNRVELYLKQTRYQALIDDKYDENEDLWHKRRWTMKFFRCRESVGGIYFSIYSERNDTGHPNQKESLKDPLTNKYLYNNNFCKDSVENSKYTLLTKNYNIKTVDVSCNNTDSLGQISFGSDGRVYSKLSSNFSEKYDYEIKKPCKIKFMAENNDSFEITILPKTGFVE